MLQRDGQTRYTQHGLFDVDDDGFLIDAFTGYYVERTGSVGEEPVGESSFQQPGDQRIRIPLGHEVPPSPTSWISLTGTLPEDSRSDTYRLLASVPLTEYIRWTDTILPASSATLVNDLDSTYSAYPSGDRLGLSGQRGDGTLFSETVDVGPTTTVGDLMDAIEMAFGGDVDVRLQDGRIELVAIEPGESQLKFRIDDLATNIGNVSVSFSSPFEVLAPGAPAYTFGGALPIIDHDGQQRTLSYTMRKVAADVWKLTFAIDPSVGRIVDSSPNLIRFGEDGRPIAGPDGVVSPGTLTLLAVGDGRPQQISILLQSLEGRDLIEGPGPAEISTSLDGLRPGEISSAFLSKNVQMVGVSSNGNIYTVADLAVASFDAPEWLADAGFEQFEETHLSGPAVQRSNTATEQFVPTWSYAFDEKIDRFLQAHPQTVRPGFLLDDAGRLLLTVPGATAAEGEVFHDQHDVERRLSTPAISSDEVDGAVEASGEISRTWLDQLFRTSTPSLISTIIAADTGSTAGSLELELLSGEEDGNRQRPKPPVRHADYEAEPPVARHRSTAKQ